MTTKLVTEGGIMFYKVEAGSDTEAKLVAKEIKSILDNSPCEMVAGKFEDGEDAYVRPYGESGLSADIKNGRDVMRDNKVWREFLNGFAKRPNGDGTKINPRISLRSALLQVRRATEEAKKAFLNYENYTLGLVWKEPVKKFSSLKQYRRWKKKRWAY